jgi:hypothetical protein
MPTDDGTEEVRLKPDATEDVRLKADTTGAKAVVVSGFSRTWARIASVFQAIAILTFLLLVLRDQYGVPSLQACDPVTFDAWFLGAVIVAAIARALARRSAAEGRLFLFRLGALTIVTLLAVMGAEYAARLQFRHARTSGNAGDYIAHSGAWSAGPSNSLGFRDREVPPTTPGKYRIVVVGDSFTWGAGIEREERFSNLLEQFLGPRYEVFNFGIPGDNMPEHLGVLERALAVHPDFVLLQLYVNDFETQNMHRPNSYALLPASLDSRLSQSSLLYDLLQDKWSQIQEAVGISEGYVHYMNANLSDRDGPNSREAFGNFKLFFERARAAGVPAGSVFFPETDALGPHGTAYPFHYLHEGVQRACADERVTCLDLLPLFSTFEDARAVWVSPFDAHPNARANRLAAYEILKAFAPAWQH